MTLIYEHNISDIFMNGGFRIKNTVSNTNNNINDTNNNINNTFYDETNNNNNHGGSKELLMHRFSDLVIPFGLITNKEYFSKEHINKNLHSKIIENNKFDAIFDTMLYKKLSNNRITRKNKKK